MCISSAAGWGTSISLVSTIHEISKLREEKRGDAHLFVFGILGTQNVHPSFSSDYAASVTHDLDGGPDFHSPYEHQVLRRVGIEVWMWVSVIRRELNSRLTDACEERTS